MTFPGYGDAYAGGAVADPPALMVGRHAVIDFNSGVRVWSGRQFTPSEQPTTSVELQPATTVFPLSPVEVEATPGTPPPPVVTEEFPDSGTVDRFFTPSSTQSQINAISAGEIVEFAPGNYGDKNLNGLSGKSGVYAFCRAVLTDDGTFGYRWDGSPANFQHVHDGVCYDHPFAWNLSSNTTLRGFGIRGFSPNPKSGSDYRGSGVIRPQGSDCNVMDCLISRSRESAIMPTGSRTTMRRCAAHMMGKYMWGAQVGQGSRVFDSWCHEVYTSVVRNAGLSPAVVSSDRGVCKNPPGARDVEVDGMTIWNIDGKGVWWDGGERGVCRNVTASNVNHNVVSFEISLGPFLAEDIYAEDSAIVRGTGDVISAVVLWPLTPEVTVRRVEAVRCGNGVCTHNRNHSVLTNGFGPYSAEQARNLLGVRDSLVEDCDFSSIKGGSGSLANRYNAGWAGGSFSVEGDTITFEEPRWRNNTYSPSPEFRRGGSWPLTLAQWQAAGHS